MKKVNIDHLEQKELLEEIWNSVYAQRRKKVGKKRAIISANARVYAEACKFFVESNSKKKEVITKTITILEENKEYKTYNVGDNKVIITMKQEVLNKFPMAERKGQFKNMNDGFEREIFSKLIDGYGLTLSPEMYYVINGDK